MLNLIGYNINEKIHENNKIRVFRGRRTRDSQLVVIKALKEEASNPSEISRLIHEYEMTQSLDCPGTVKPLQMEQEGTVFALVLADNGAVSLREYLRHKSIHIPSFLDIAEQLSETLGQLHQHGVIHRDLKLENIVIHPETGKVTIIDFGMAVRWGTYEQKIEESDYRSDIYSLGVVFYELLTGKPQWQTEDEGEWEYTDPSLQVLRAIVCKIMDKMPDDRYQSAFGLLQDLLPKRPILLPESMTSSGKTYPMPLWRRPLGTC